MKYDYSPYTDVLASTVSFVVYCYFSYYLLISYIYSVVIGLKVDSVIISLSSRWDDRQYMKLFGDIRHERKKGFIQKKK